LYTNFACTERVYDGHLLAEGAAVAEDHVVGNGNGRDDPQLVVTDAVAPNIQLEVDERQANGLRPLRGQAPATARVAEVLLGVVRAGDEADVCPSSFRRHVPRKARGVVRASALDARYCARRIVRSHTETTAVKTNCRISHSGAHS